MQVFVTGASGHIASGLIPELLGAGHKVIGLARSDASAVAVASLGADVHRGSLDDLESLRQAVAASDGVIHLAFKHESMRSGDFVGAVEADWRAIEAMGDELAGTGKPFVGTSGTLMLTLGEIDGVATEADVLAAGPRIDAENAVIALADRGVRSSVVRLPPTVHSSLDHHGYVPTLIAVARERRMAGYVGDGSNRWPAGHTLDAASLLPFGARRSAGRVTTARSRRRRCAVPRDRRGHRPPPDSSVRQHFTPGCRGPFWLSCSLRLTRQPHIEQADPATARLAPDPSRAHRRSQRGPLLLRSSR